MMVNNLIATCSRNALDGKNRFGWKQCALASLYNDSKFEKGSPSLKNRFGGGRLTANFVLVAQFIECCFVSDQLGGQFPVQART